LLPDSEDHAAIDLSRPEPVKDVIDGLERQRLYGRFYFAFGGEHQRFLQVQARAHNRSADGVAVQDHIENRNRNCLRRSSSTSLCIRFLDLHPGEQACRDQYHSGCDRQLLEHSTPPGEGLALVVIRTRNPPGPSHGLEEQLRCGRNVGKN
jgi:hypothetical protein